MKTFSIVTLGCKVNQYESDQVASLLRALGLRQVEAGADLRIVNTCSVTMQAASKSRQAVRREGRTAGRTGLSLPVLAPEHISVFSASRSFTPNHCGEGGRARVVVIGCWATSDPAEAAGLAAVDAVLGHHDDVADGLQRLLVQWDASDLSATAAAAKLSPSESGKEDGWILKDGTLAGDVPRGQINVERSGDNKSQTGAAVNEILINFSSVNSGTMSLPILGGRRGGHQRAFLKVQDGCDAHCTYCIIPQLRSRLWSKPVDDAVREVQALVDAGHREIVLTGVFLGAYGHETALRRRQRETSSKLGGLIEALCNRVAGLRRLRLSSLEPGDLTGELITILREHPQVVPHFHLPLQSGSERLLRRMNRQYTRDDFLRMVDAVNEAFDRPALTTDIIVGFPGETDREFQRTVQVVDRARFIHVHAFSYSPRAKTAAARWTRDFIRGPVVNQRIDALRARAEQHSLAYRSQFVGETVEVMVEREREAGEPAEYQHGRCERYFTVHFASDRRREGEMVRLRISRVTQDRTLGEPIG